MQKFGLNAGRHCVRSFCSSAGVPAPSTPHPVSHPVSAKVKFFALGNIVMGLGTILMYWTDFRGCRTRNLLRTTKARLETTEARLEEARLAARLAEAKEFSKTGRTRLPGDEDNGRANNIKD